MTNEPLTKQGPQGSTVKGTAFDIQPKSNAAKTRIKRLRLKAGWAIDSLQVEYENLGAKPAETYFSANCGGPGGNLVEFALDPDDYITEIIGSWGAQMRGYPKAEIITLQFKTHKGVTSRVMGGGNPLKDVQPFSFKAPPDCQIIGFFGEYGKTFHNLGIYTAKVSTAETKTEGETKTGKIVINGDEWTLSNDGIKVAPDAAIFATNIAKWFVGDRPGKFHAYSTNFGLNQSALAEAMQKAGHTWTIGTTIKLDLPTLLTYDGIFIGGEVAVDNQLLIEYVKAGGNVYLMAGTGAGDAPSEAARWNTFLNAFGFNFIGQYNGIRGNQPIKYSHPILTGVKELFQHSANPIVNLDTTSGKNQIILTRDNGEGLIATFDGSLSTQQPSTVSVLDDGLIAHYLFNGNAQDTSGHNLHGTVYGATPTTDRFGNSGSAYQFDGVDDYIEVPHNNLLNLTDNFTISLWLKQEAGQVPGYRLVDKNTPGLSNGYIFDTYDGNTGRKLRLSAAGANIYSKTVYSLNEWHHVAVVFSKGVSTFYLDGQPDGGEKHTNTSVNTNTLTLRIGTAHDSKAEFFKGALDDIRIYGRTLSEQEIKAIHQLSSKK